MKHNYKYYLRLLWVKMMRLGSLSGCHQLPQRSFFISGYQFPVCARCCGVLIGQMLTVLLFAFKILLGLPLAIIMLLVMFVDWFIQFIEIKESNNTRRFLTGICGGLGSWTVFIRIFKWVYKCIKTRILN